MTTVGTAEGWTRELDALAARIAPRFVRAEPRAEAGAAARIGMPAATTAAAMAERMLGTGTSSRGTLPFGRSQHR